MFRPTRLSSGALIFKGTAAPSTLLRSVFSYLQFFPQYAEIKQSYNLQYTQTDIIIRNDSCHSHKQKTSGINYLLNRLHTYPITQETKQKELYITKTCCTTITESGHIPPHTNKRKTSIHNAKR
jgi:hypothetical protein